MPKIIVYGHSDDLIEFRGDFYEEFSHYSDYPETIYINGNPIITIGFRDGWRIDRAQGAGRYANVTWLHFANENRDLRNHPDTDYNGSSDVVQIEWKGPILIENSATYNRRISGIVVCPNCDHEFKN